MKKGHIVLGFWAVFLVTGSIAAATLHFFPTVLAILSGIGVVLTTGVYFAEKWEELSDR